MPSDPLERIRTARELAHHNEASEGSFTVAVEVGLSNSHLISDETASMGSARPFSAGIVPDGARSSKGGDGTPRWQRHRFPYPRDRRRAREALALLRHGVCAGAVILDATWRRRFAPRCPACRAAQGSNRAETPCS